MDWWHVVLLCWFIDLALRFIVRGRPTVYGEGKVLQGRTGIFSEPGILAQAENQMAPIADLLRKYGAMYYCTIGRIVYSPSHVARRHARRIAEIARAQKLDKLIFVGVSLGGTTALDVAEQLQKIAPDLPKPELILFEGIGSGSKNLLSGGNVAAPIFAWLRFVPIGLVARVVIESIIEVPKSLWINQGPKDSEIEDDIVINGTPYTKEETKKKAQKDMSWYLLGVFARQMVHMHASRLTDKRLQRFARIAYFEYTLHNVTVHQPAERLAWQSAAESAGVEFLHWEIATPHVAFWQAPSENRQVIGRALESMFH